MTDRCPGRGPMVDGNGLFCSVSGKAIRGECPPGCEIRLAIEPLGGTA